MIGGNIDFQRKLLEEIQKETCPLLSNLPPGCGLHGCGKFQQFCLEMVDGLMVVAELPCGRKRVVGVVEPLSHRTSGHQAAS